MMNQNIAAMPLPGPSSSEKHAQHHNKFTAVIGPATKNSQGIRLQMLLGWGAERGDSSTVMSFRFKSIIAHHIVNLPRHASFADALLTPEPQVQHLKWLQPFQRRLQFWRATVLRPHGCKGFQKLSQLGEA